MTIFHYLLSWFLEFLSNQKFNLVKIYTQKKNSEKVNFLKKYLDFNTSYFCKKYEKNSFILVDCFPIPDWIFVNSVFLNCLALENNSEVVTYGLRKRDGITNAIYDSFGCKKHLQVTLNYKMKLERLKLFVHIKKNLRAKKDLFNLHIDGVWVGMDIYESILRSGTHTVSINSIRTSRHLYIAITYFIYFAKVFTLNEIKAVALSHDNYIGMGLIARIAYKNNVPVYLANAYGIMKTNHTHQIYEKYTQYKNLFEKLDDEERLNAIEWSKGRLARRLEGEVGIEMSYQTKSAYHALRFNRQLNDSAKLKVVVATHCFYDSPHGFGGMLFTDFYEWLTFLGSISLETDYEWYLKPHSDYLPGTIEVLQEFTKAFPLFKIIDPKVSWHQLKDEGATFALTCYGSIGHELPLLGWKVINASYNPHIAYKFNWHANDKAHYKELLKNLANLSEIQEIEKIYEFFYVHKKLVSEDNFFFDSAEEMNFSSSDDFSRLKAFNDFVEDAPKVFNRASERITSYIKSGAISTNKFISSAAGST
jgi:hypothetical protein